MYQRAIRLYKYLAIIILTLTSCGKTEETVGCFPISPINVILNLNLPAYYPLMNTGGWIYVDEQSSGSRGLIIVKNNSGFMIYDRNAPHLCPDENTTLLVENNIKIVCPKDNSEWILITGEPIKNAKLPPKSYPYYYNSGTNTLTINY